MERDDDTGEFTETPGGEEARESWEWQTDDELIYMGVWYSVLYAWPDEDGDGYWLEVWDQDGANRVIHSNGVTHKYDRM